LEAEEEKVQQRRRDLQLPERMLREFSQQTEELKKAQQRFLQAREQSTELGRQYVELEAAFLSGQAGILAQTLQMGAPCPVCGSLEHPLPAVCSGKTPSEAELRSLSAKKEQALARTTEASGVAAEARGKYEQSRISLESWCERVQVDGAIRETHVRTNADEPVRRMEDGTEPAREIQNEIKEALAARVSQYLQSQKQQLQELARQQEQKRRELTVLLKEKEKLEQQQPLLEQKILKLRKEKELCAQEQIRCRTQASAGTAQMEELKKQLLYGSYEEAQRAASELQQTRKRILDAIQNAQEQLERCRRNIAAEERAIELLQNQIAQEDTTEAEQLSERMTEISGQREALERRQKQRHVLLRTDENILEQLQKCRKQMEKTEEAYQTLAALSDTANGELKGRPKLAFEQYIQTVFFGQIIQEANKRFAVMSDNRYLLKRREAAGNLRSQTGLDLDVFDYYTGRLRSVESLSGGESFKASLSLALGLADVVQRYAGGVQLDAIFIDEGFGSLDRESLNQAIRILNELAEGRRLAGIISHVEELKERIDRKIIVQKGTTGSTLTIVRP
jgi:exonuclease SbcC